MAVGLVAAHGGVSDLALGTAFGGGVFIVCLAVGLGAVLIPLRVELPARVLAALAASPVLVELEEVIRQTVPAREGHPDVSAGNLVGLGLIALASPVQVSRLTRTLDWPFLVASTWLTTVFLRREPRPASVPPRHLRRLRGCPYPSEVSAA